MRALTILTTSAAFLLMITTTISPRAGVALAASDDDQHRRGSILWRGSSLAVGHAPVNGMGSRAELRGDDGALLVLQDCLDDCNCHASGCKKGGTGKCHPEIAVWNVRGSRGPDTTSTSVRIGPSSRYLRTSGGGGEINFGYFYRFLAGLFVVEAIFILIGYLFIFVLADPSASPSRRVHGEEGYGLVPGDFRRFAYDELSRATWDFAEELGRAVYKGVLGDGRAVSVTRLAEAADGELFMSELGDPGVIGRISHMNLAKIWGFCSEGPHRLLVCEYVENGSLAEALFGGENETPLAWHSRYKVAVGAAKGLAYLHHECILHCDVKPENILLDADLEPKITGFGLVKLLSREDNADDATGSHVLPWSLAQGANRGYVAPESALGQPVTGKADVYSFGVVLLELLSGQRVSEWLVMEGERTGYQRLVAFLNDEMESQYRTSVPEWLPEFVDVRLLGDFSHMQAAAMLDLAVTCVHDDPGRRPGMNVVVQNLISLQ